MTKNEILKYPLLTLFSLTLALAGCQKSEAQDPGQVTARPVKLTNVEVQTVHSTELEEYLTLTGHTEAAHDIIISSEQGGTVLELLFDRGDRVTAGQVLCRVSDDIYKAQLAEAEANLRLKEAGLKKAAALYERGSITAMNRLQAQVEYDAAAANVEIAKSRLDRAVIKAPISGKIEDRFIDIGEMVPPGGRLFRLADRRKIKIKSEFAELDVSTFKPGIAAEVHFDALPDTVFTARLVFVSSSAHEASRTFPCEFELDNLREMIRGGMIARINVLKNTYRNVVVLQQTALVETQSGRSLFVLEGETARKREVTLGASNRGMIIIAKGIKPEEVVIVNGQRELVDGQQVRVTGRKD